jgi:DNA polymerase III delta subunit
MERGVSSGEVAARLKIWYKKEDFFARVRKTSLRKTGLMLEQLAQIDYSIKSGRMKAETAVEQLVLKMSGT